MNEEEKLAGFTPESAHPNTPENVAEKEKPLETSGEKPHEQQKPAPTAETGRFKLPKLRHTVNSIPSYQDPQIQKIEKILESGLNDSYARLSPIAKQEFKLKGEETALKINELLKHTHVKVKKIVRLILDWLRMLPGVNRFFLEQEAKIKTDQILSLKKK